MPNDCLMGEQCRSRRSLQLPGDATSRGICMPCELHGRYAIRQLHPDWIVLDSLIGKDYGNSGGTSYVPVKRIDPPIPLRAEIDYLARWIAWNLEEWEYVVRRQARLSQVEVQLRSSATVPRAARLLDEHYAVLLAVPVVHIVDYETNEVVQANGLGAIAWFIELHRRAQSAMGMNRVREHRALPCPDPPVGCGLAELASYLDGLHGVGDDVFCTNCGWRCSAEQYSTYLKTFLPPGDQQYAEAA